MSEENIFNTELANVATNNTNHNNINFDDTGVNHVGSDPDYSDSLSISSNVDSSDYTSYSDSTSYDDSSLSDNEHETQQSINNNNHNNINFDDTGVIYVGSDPDYSDSLSISSDVDSSDYTSYSDSTSDDEHELQQLDRASTELEAKENSNQRTL